MRAWLIVLPAVTHEGVAYSTKQDVAGRGANFLIFNTWRNENVCCKLLMFFVVYGADLKQHLIVMHLLSVRVWWLL